MTVTTRRLAALAAPALLVASLSACGAGGPPADASEDDFCAAYNGPLEDLAGGASAGEVPGGAEIYDAVQEQVTQLEETGTPEGISDDERSGFEVYIETIPDVDEDEFVAAIEEGEEPDDTTDLSEEEDEQAEAFTEYASETCGEPAAG